MITLKAAIGDQQTYLDSHQWVYDRYYYGSFYFCSICKTRASSVAYTKENIDIADSDFYLDENYKLTCNEVILKDIME